MNDRLQFIEDGDGEPAIAVIHEGLSPQATKLMQYALPHITDCIDEVCEWFEIEHGDLEALATVCQDGRNWFSEDPVLVERLSKDVEDPFSMCLECSLFCLSAFLDTLEPPAQMAEAAVNLAKSVEYLSAFKAATVFAGNMPPEKAAACMEEVVADLLSGRLVGWKKSVNTAWPKLLQLHGRKPSAEELVRYLERDDPEGFVVPSGVPDELKWKTKRGKPKLVSRRTIEDHIGELPGPRA